MYKCRDSSLPLDSSRDFVHSKIFAPNSQTKRNQETTPQKNGTLNTYLQLSTPQRKRASATVYNRFTSPSSIFAELRTVEPRVLRGDRGGPPSSTLRTEPISINMPLDIPRTTKSRHQKTKPPPRCTRGDVSCLATPNGDRESCMAVKLGQRLSLLTIYNKHQQQESKPRRPGLCIRVRARTRTLSKTRALGKHRLRVCYCFVDK